MLLNLGLYFLILLVFLLPQAQSGRVRFSAPHPRHHSPTHLHATSSQSNPIKASEHETPKPHIQLVTGSSLQHPHASASGLNRGGIAQTLVVSGPNPDGNLNTLVANILDTPVSGPNPGGNSATLGNALFDAPTSGPNHPEGNSQILNAGSGPNPGGDSKTLVANMLDTSVTGSNPGGNLQILAASSGPNPDGNSEILSQSSGPNPGGNSEGLMSSDGRILLGNVGRSFSAALKVSSSSEPKPNGNFVQLVRFRTASDLNVSQNAEILHAGGIIFSELPRAPAPPSGPSPSHNSVVTQQGLFAERKLRGVIIGCEQEEEKGLNLLHGSN